MDATRSVVENWSLSNDVAAHVRIDGTPATGPGDDVVLRVVQESLANVSRPAAATSVTLTLSWLGDERVVDVRDDGMGERLSAPVAG